MTIPDPIEPRIDLLPLNHPEWEWKRFERFCLALVEALPDVRRAHLYGTRGQAQRGIDIVAELTDGSKRTYQCRKVQRFTLSSAKKTVKETTYEAAEHVIVTTCEVGTAVRDYIRELDGWEVWDIEDICRRVRDIDPRERARRIIEDAFGVRWRRAFLGPDGPQVFLTAEDFFEPFLNEKQLFRHTWELVGRDQLVQELAAAIEEPATRIVVVAGRGGIGKTRILRAVAGAAGGSRTVLFARDDAEFTDETVDELPFENAVVIVDDVHRRDPDELGPLLSLIQRRDPPITLVLATRPQRMEELRGALARRQFDGSEVAVFGPLGDLEIDETEALARQALGEGFAGLASALARATADCPLVTVFGGLLLARELVPPALLERHADFRAEVLERFTEERLGHISREVDPQLARRVLELLSALQPISVANGELLEHLAGELMTDAPELRRVLGELEDAGLVLARGRYRRIIPDVLADHILHRSCVDAQGRSTGRATALVQKFGQVALGPLMRNLAELDWRLDQTGDRLDLLRDVLDVFQAEFEAGDAVQRLNVLEQLKRIAVFLPDRILALADWALQNAATPGQMFGYELTDEDVRQKLPELIGPGGYSPGHTSRAMELLWRIGRDDSRDTNPNPSHAIRVVQELGSYELPRYYGETLVEVVETLLAAGEGDGHHWSPLQLLSPLLAREGFQTESLGFQIRWGGYGVNSAAVEPLRARVRGLLLTQALSGTGRNRWIALELLTNALHQPFGFGGRPITQESIDQWLPEQRALFDILDQILDESNDPFIPGNVRQAVAWHAERSAWKEIRDRAQTILDRPIGDAESIALALTHPYEFGVGDGPENRMGAAAKSIGAMEASDAVALLEGLLTRAWLATGKSADAGPLIFQLAKETPDVAVEIVETVLCDPTSPLQPFVAAALGPLRAAEPVGQAELVARMTAVPALRRSLAVYVAGCDWTDDTGSQEETLLAEYVVDSDPVVLNSALLALHRFASRDPLRAKPYALAAEIGIDSHAADRLFAGISRSSMDLSTPEIEQLLQKLEAVGDLQHHTTLFLSSVARNSPTVVVDFFLGRLVRPWSMGYHAVPYHFEGDALGERQGEDRIELLRRLRDGLVLDGVNTSELARFFWSLARDLDENLRVIQEWSDDPDRMLDALPLVEDIEWGALLARPQFVSDLLERAASVDEEHLKLVRSSLSAAATSGDFSRTPGQPAPRDVVTQEKAAEAAAMFARGSLAHRFFKDLQQRAQDRIKEAELEDEEFGEA